ncbi:MAG: ABC transporter permease subunit, partial [Pirellulales bacterium]
VLAGTQVVRNIGDLARFGASVFAILAPLQLAVVLFFSSLSAASAVAAEKDRQTLVLLLMTNLSNAELVLGKLLASMLNVLVLVAAAVPLFMLMALLGGISFEQIARVFAVTLASALAAGSLGSTLALWREKTFQTLAMTALALVFWLAAGELVAQGALGSQWAGVSTSHWAIAISPWQAMIEATRPFTDVQSGGWLASPVHQFLLVSLGAALALNALATAMVRVWNPSREARRGAHDPRAENHPLAQSPAGPVAATQAVTAPAQPIARSRPVWDNPIIWREMRTWAYGRKILVVRAAYLVLFALTAAGMYAVLERSDLVAREDLALVLVPLLILSLVLVNAQAVTALTSERDARALDLLLVTDLTPKEFIFGKLGGVLYNTKEMVLLPMALCGAIWYSGLVSFENLVYLLGGWLVMCGFVAMLGVHVGMNYVNSKSAIAASLGTVFFLFIGVAVCMRIMVAFSGSFQVQLTPFLAFIIGGGAGLYAALGWRNPSGAIQMASIICPFAIFYAITSFLIGYTLGVFLVLAFTFGFTTLTMLIPALSEFDVATGRTSGAGEEG